jgi:uncharacterized protein
MHARQLSNDRPPGSIPAPTSRTIALVFACLLAAPGCQRDRPACTPDDLQACQRRCAAGELDACLVWVRDLTDGMGPKPDLEPAAAVLRQGCEQKEAEACFLLARMQREGLTGDAADAAAAHRLAARACELGSAAGCALAGLALCSGGAVPTDCRRGVALLERACTAGQADGCFNAGVAWARGKPGIQKQSRAADLFDKACALGDAMGCYRLAFQFEHGLGRPADIQQARGLLRKACAGDVVEACRKLHADAPRPPTRPASPDAGAPPAPKR